MSDTDHADDIRTARELIDDYLIAFEDALPGPDRGQTDAIDELRDALIDAAIAHRADTRTGTAAACAAIEEFGQPDAVATVFCEELAARHARHTTIGLTRTGPVLAAVWSAVLMIDPAFRPESTPGVALGAAVVAVAIVVAALGTMAAVAVTGRPIRWLCPGARAAPTAAVLVGGSAIVADLTLLSVLVSTMSSGPRILVLTVNCIAFVLSATRLAVAWRATRRGLAYRAALA